MLARTFPHPRAAALKPLALALSAGALAGAAQAQTTPAQFVEACRLNPANTVVLTQATKFQGAFQGSTFATPTGCTVVLAPGASFELDTITMRFGGPFVVQGAEKAKVSLDKATLIARAVNLMLTGAEGQFQMNEARVSSTVGNVALKFGDKGFMEVKNSGGWYQPRLAAAARLSLTAGAFFTGSVVQSGLQGATGITMSFDGADSSMKIENSDLLVSSGAPNAGTYTNGPFSVIGHAAKVSVELSRVNLMEAGQNVTMTLNGAESKLGLLSLTSQTRSQRIVLSADGEKGEVKVENPLLLADPEIIIESGALGSTTVLTSPGTIHATQLAVVRTGVGGSCTAIAGGISAPVQRICR